MCPHVTFESIVFLESWWRVLTLFLFSFSVFFQLLINLVFKSVFFCGDLCIFKFWCALIEESLSIKSQVVCLANKKKEVPNAVCSCEMYIITDTHLCYTFEIVLRLLVLWPCGKCYDLRDCMNSCFEKTGHVKSPWLCL